MHTYKVIYRKLENGSPGVEAVRVVHADNVTAARLMVLTRGVIIERIIRL